MSLIPRNALMSMLCITTILVVALLKDINGVLLAGGIATLAGLGGFAIGKRSNRSGTGL